MQRWSGRVEAHGPPGLEDAVGREREAGDDEERSRRVLDRDGQESEADRGPAERADEGAEPVVEVEGGGVAAPVTGTAIAGAAVAVVLDRRRSRGGELESRTHCGGNGLGRAAVSGCVGGRIGRSAHGIDVGGSARE